MMQQMMAGTAVSPAGSPQAMSQENAPAQPTGSPQAMQPTPEAAGVHHNPMMQLQQLRNSPMMQPVMQQMFSNPQVMQHVQQMMSDPQAMHRAMQMMSGQHQGVQGGMPPGYGIGAQPGQFGSVGLGMPAPAAAGAAQTPAAGPMDDMMLRA